MVELSGNIFFEGPAGRIEAILKEPAGAVNGVSVVCHPHPLFGGTMHNKVVYTMARALNRAGFSVLRFNFRGVGRSEGEYDEGRGEQQDLRAAMVFIRAKHPGAGLWLGGFSFGASVMLRVACDEPAVGGLIAAGLPVSKYDFSKLAECNKPKLFVQGALDQYGSVSDLEALFKRLAEPKRLAVVEGADHFFGGHLEAIERAVFEFVSLHAERGGPT